MSFVCLAAIRFGEHSPWGERMSRVTSRILSGFLFSLVAVCCAAAVRADTPKAPVRSKAAIARNFGNLPLSFEPNRGQASPAARYTAHGRSSTVYLTPDGATIVVTHVPEAASRRNVATASTRVGGKLVSDILKQVRSSRLTMKFPGAAHAVKISGEDRLSGTANYFIGKDAAQWRTKIPTYGKVRYASLYPGVDVVFYGTDGKLEYDLLVSPGADPSRVRLAFEGAKRIDLNPDGDLIASAGGDQIVIHQPVIYQLDGRNRKKISGGFVRLPHDQIGVRVASYDRARPLIIDPAITYAIYVSGSAFDTINWSTIDIAGDQYLTGMACSGDFPTSSGAHQTSPGGGCDAYVTELNPSGTELIYSTFLGGNMFDQGNGIAVDGSGAVYVVGETAGNFPIAPANAFQSTDPGLPIEGFVAKLSSDGSKLIYSSYLGGSQAFPGAQDRAFGVAVPQGCGGPNCNAYVVGQTPACDFPTAGTPVQAKNAGYSMSGPGCLSSQTSNPFDAYVAEFSSDGTSLVYSTYLGGKGGDFGGAIAVDSAGDAFVTGLTDEAFGAPTLQTTPGAAQPNFGGTADAFAIKLNPTGSQLLYSTFLGGSGFDLGQDITLDGSGDAYVCGLTYSADFPIFGAHVLQPTLTNFSGWLSELNSTGGFVFSTYFGNLSSQAAQRVALDGSGNIYVAGWANIPSNVPSPYAFQAVNPVQAAPSPSGVVLQSTDNGSTFHNSGFPLDVGSANHLTVDASTSNPGHTVYVGTLRGGLFVSTDDGNTFSPTSITGAVFSADLDTNATPPTLYVGASTGFYSVVGTTVSPTSFTTPFATLGIDTTASPSTIYVQDATVNRLDTTVDGGHTFQAGISIPAGTKANSIARDPNTGTLYLATNRGVLTSTGGAPFVQTILNWTTVSQVLVDYNSSPSIVYATTQNNGVVWSTDGFNATVNQPLGPFFSGVGDLDIDRTTTPATVYAGTGNGVFFSTNGGQSYHTTQLGGGNPFINAIAIDPGSPNGIFANLFLDTTPSIAEISPDGSTLLFSSLFGGSETGITEGLNVASNGSIYLAGGTFAHDFPTTLGAFQPGSSAQFSGFALNISNTAVGTGSNQTAMPNGGTTVTGNTSSGGTTSATTSSTNPINTPLPPGETAVSQYTDITTTASYTGLITVCINYNPAQTVDTADLSLLHFQENQWANITTGNNTMTGVICGQVTSSSPFVIALKIQPITMNDCKSGSWQKWKNPSFKNQGQCIKFVNHS
jgi:hypothetical protein